MTEREQVQSLGRGLRILEALNQNRVTSLAALNQITGLPKPSLVRLLETLIEAGYVTRVSRREGYTLTDAVLRLSSGVRHRDVVVDVARPLMEGFTRRHKWQVSLATSESDSMLIRFTTRHLSPFAREENFLNRRIHMLQSAVGRAYIAFCSDEERELILGFVRAAGDPLAITEDPPRIAALLAQVRHDGYATTERPRANPTRSFAVPVMEPGVEESPLGSIAFFYYRTAMNHSEATRRYLGPVRALADEIAVGLAEAREAAEIP
jgi:IclR family mhp operon transcriptional activator